MQIENADFRNSFILDFGYKSLIATEDLTTCRSTNILHHTDIERICYLNPICLETQILRNNRLSKENKILFSLKKVFPA